MTTLWLDFETRSSVDIRRSNVYRYAEAPDFAPILLAIAVDDGEVKTYDGPDRIRKVLSQVRAKYKDAIWVAHNAGFERAVMRALELPVPIPQWADTMAMAQEIGMPASLKYLAKFVGAEDKDEAGARLINLFCKPVKTGGYVQPTDRVDDWLDFVEYCRQDVETMRDIVHQWDTASESGDSVADWMGTHEFKVWCADQAINERGIRIDHKMAELAVKAADENHEEQKDRIRQITGVSNPGSVPQLVGWLNEQGIEIDNLRKETVSLTLDRDDLTPEVREVLELRRELALVAYKKFIAALEHECADHRLRGQFRFFGAHTGRWTGTGVQLHNLARAGFQTEDEEQIAIDELMMGFGAEAQTLKKLVRPMMIGPFVVADYSAIEARVLAWLAGEQWVLDAFAGGRDIYVETAVRMGPQYTRKEGKVAVLALGYNGALGSMRAMGATGSDEELLEIVRGWRETNSKIVRFWHDLERAFRKGGTVGAVTVKVVGRDRHIVLPSGRSLVYYNVKTRMVPNDFGTPKPRTSFLDSRYGRVDTYGGRLAENVTQAVARDLLAAALVNLTHYGYAVVGHVHDEVLIEVDKPNPDYLEPVVKIMCDNPRWAKGLPLDAAGFVTNRYCKER